MPIPDPQTVEQVIARWRKEEADYGRLASERAALAGYTYVYNVAKHELAKRYADELEAALRAHVPAEIAPTTKDEEQEARRRTMGTSPDSPTASTDGAA